MRRYLFKPWVINKALILIVLSIQAKLKGWFYLMKILSIKNTDLKVSNVVMGCMRISEFTESQAQEWIEAALELGINHFDHADIYGGGKCETIFGKALKACPSLREKMIIQSKCGIRPGFFDFSKEHIINSVDLILSRLGTDSIDSLLLHRPDTLIEPEETAEAFQQLFDSGKVRSFGVSNQNPMQIELLQKYSSQKLIFNQLQLSIAHTPMIDSGIASNMGIPQSIERTGSILEYCRLKDITIQAWSPFQYGFFEGNFLTADEKYPELTKLLDELAKKYSVTRAGIATAWLTRHPADMQVIIGTTSITHMKESCAGSELPLTRAEWYGLYKAAGNILP